MSTLRGDYMARRSSMLMPLASRLEPHLKSLFSAHPRIDRITARPKATDRFMAKAEKLEDNKPKYSDPLNQIQDQVGARIVTFYKSDVDALAKEVHKYFRHIEARDFVPDSPKEFGYEGMHFILFFPRDIFDEKLKEDDSVPFFELQLKTLFQHAWSEAEHDLGYKPSSPLTYDQRRRLAFSAAQAWGADTMFEELHKQTSG